MPTQCNAYQREFQRANGKRVVAAFDGGDLTSNAGALLVREIGEQSGLFERVAACFKDYRDPKRVTHSLKTLVAQRIVGLVHGYEDLNDHDHLRHDPVLGLLADDGRRDNDRCAALAGKSTLGRIEQAPVDGAPTRYHKVIADMEALQELLVDTFIESHDRKSRFAPPRLVLDADASDIEVHGKQEGRRFHGYYGHHCYLPLYVTCGRHVLRVAMRPGNSDPAGGTIDALKKVVSQMRRAWPGVPILLRADSAYAREDIMAWCEAQGVDYCIGLARNKRLEAEIAGVMDDAQAKAKRTGRPVRIFKGLKWKTKKSWSRERRVVAKVEHLVTKANPRFVVTSLDRSIRDRRVYESIYCTRGRAENVIKEQQLDLFGDRASAMKITGNQLRTMFSAIAVNLIEMLRAHLVGTRLARATAATLRLALFKIAATFKMSVRRFKIAMDSNHPYAREFAIACHRARAP